MGIQRKKGGQPHAKALAKSGARFSAGNALKELPVATPGFVEPMKSLTQSAVPREAGWSLELKLDGIRAIAFRDGETLRIFSRRPRDLTAEYPEIVNQLRRLPAKQWVVDGEIVALDERGHSSFQLLQNRSQRSVPIVFYIFDLINVGGRDLKSLPLLQRRIALNDLLRKSGNPLRFSASLDAPAASVWREVVRLGLEGVVAKRCDSTYEPGRRSGAWRKVKALREQEFVIGGYTAPEGSRKFFGAILVGYYQKGDLLFASKVGTGFNHAALKSLFSLFQKHRISACPFRNPPTRRGGRFGQGISASEMRKCSWLNPKLVCQVKFLEWTQDGNLRQPVFRGLRDDKRAREIVREGV
jgi:bifunctional non-homologous end joining protein LigD